MAALGVGARVAAAAGDEIDDFVDRSFRRTISRYRRRLRDAFLPSKLHGAYQTVRNVLTDPTTTDGATDVGDDDDELVDNAEVICDEPETRCGRICRYVNTLRLEMFFFLYTLAYTIQYATSNNLLAVKACVLVMNKTVDVCNELQKEGKIQTEAQKIADLYSIYQALISFLPGCLVTLVISSYCDLFCRYKIPLCVVLLGGVISNIGSLFTAIYFTQAGMFYNLLCPLPEGFLGGMPAVLMATYALIARSTTKKHRTAKFFTLQIAFMLALPIGKIISALVWRNHGFVPVYSTSVGVQVVAFIWTVAFVRDISKAVQPGLESSNRQQRHRNRGGGLMNLISWHYLFGTIRSAVERRANSGRLRLWLMIFAIFVLVLNSQTSYLGYYYAKKHLKWSFDTYVLVTSGFELASVVVLVPLFFLYMHYVPNHELGLAFLGIGSMMARNMFQAGSAASGQSLFFLGYGFGMLSNLAPACIRAHVSRMVSEEEYGRIFGILATVEAVAPLLNRAVLKRLFGWNLFPGFSFLMQACLLIIPLGLLLYLVCKDRRGDHQGEEITEAVVADSSDDELIT